MHEFYLDGHDFFSAAAQVLPVLLLAIVFDASLYWTVGGLVIGGLFVLLPFVGEGVSRVSTRNEHALGMRMRSVFGFVALALIAYCLAGLVILSI